MLQTKLQHKIDMSNMTHHNAWMTVNLDVMETYEQLLFVKQIHAEQPKLFTQPVIPRMAHWNWNQEILLSDTMAKAREQS